MPKLNHIILVLILQLSLVSFSQHGQVSYEPLKVYEDKGFMVKSFNFDGLENYIKPQNDTIYIVNFWATWCKPCIEELPYFEKINEEYGSKNVKVILVSMDMSKQVLSRLIPFLEKNKIKSEVVLLNDVDADVWINKVDPSWSGALPATLIYNSKKRLFFEQSFTYQSLLEQLNTFL